MYFPKPIAPSPICSSPASKNTVKIVGSALLTSPSLEEMIPAIRTILTAVIGAVGPDICVFVPPKRAAKKAINMAPYKPALGPNPELTPKANARGSATIRAVTPPNKSPLRLLNKFFIRI